MQTPTFTLKMIFSNSKELLINPQSIFENILLKKVKTTFPGSEFL